MPSCFCFPVGAGGFVAKLSADGTRATYSSVIGASQGLSINGLTIDAAGSLSRPIVEKHGFHVLTFSTPCTWSALQPKRG